MADGQRQAQPAASTGGYGRATALRLAEMRCRCRRQSWTVSRRSPSPMRHLCSTQGVRPAEYLRTHGAAIKLFREHMLQNRKPTSSRRPVAAPWCLGRLGVLVCDSDLSRTRGSRFASAMTNTCGAPASSLACRPSLGAWRSMSSSLLTFTPYRWAATTLSWASNGWGCWAPLSLISAGRRCLSSGRAVASSGPALTGRWRRLSINWKRTRPTSWIGLLMGWVEMGFMG
ncbi:hypothetical protein PVAP13_8NG204300 [Panicum virgatum]|uniref:Uncharacterized protein n=1 Tax=Panicum virgatum TaxID=38727 RepID=A0A8T0PDF8_PANVG|nr:hypothetical protein PVAP13_8NG204300 [Panicum virgatum]